MAHGVFAGDVLLSTASLEAIKRKRPRTKLTYGVWPAYGGLVDTNPHIDWLVPEVTERMKQRAMWVWEISHEAYSMAPGEMFYWGEVHARQAANLGLLDLGTMESFKPQVYLSPSDVIRREKGTNVAVVGPWSRNGVDARIWGMSREPVPRETRERVATLFPHLIEPRGAIVMDQRWVDLIAGLGKMGFQVVHLGGKGDPPLPGDVHDLRGKLTWRQSVGLLTQADLCVTIDTFLLHAALARKYYTDGSVLSEGTPTVAILGPIDGRGLFPVDALKVKEVTGRRGPECPCNDSSRFGEGPCERGNECMRRVTVEMVLNAVEEVLNA
jgi:hypothetical protein